MCLGFSAFPFEVGVLAFLDGCLGFSPSWLFALDFDDVGVLAFRYFDDVGVLAF